MINESVVSNRPEFVQFGNLNQQDRVFAHFVSMRIGGVSPRPFASLNLAANVGDSESNVLTNRMRLFEAVGMTPDSIVLCGEDDRGDGVYFASRAATADTPSSDVPTIVAPSASVATRDSGQCLMALIADDMPLIVVDPVRRVAAIAIIDVPGVLSMRAFSLITRLGQRYGCIAEDLIVALGPCAAAHAYVLGEEDFTTLKAEFPFNWQEYTSLSGHDNFGLDLPAATRIQLLEAGVTAAHIEAANQNTTADEQMFFSVRREGDTGRFAAGVMMIPSHRALGASD
jgi:polyphenol oxidase